MDETQARAWARENGYALVENEAIEEMQALLVEFAQLQTDYEKSRWADLEFEHRLARARDRFDDLRRSKPALLLVSLVGGLLGWLSRMGRG